MSLLSVAKDLFLELNREERNMFFLFMDNIRKEMLYTSQKRSSKTIKAYERFLIKNNMDGTWKTNQEQIRKKVKKQFAKKIMCADADEKAIVKFLSMSKEQKAIVEKRFDIAKEIIWQLGTNRVMLMQKIADCLQYVSKSDCHEIVKTILGQEISNVKGKNKATETLYELTEKGLLLFDAFFGEQENFKTETGNKKKETITFGNKESTFENMVQEIDAPSEENGEEEGQETAIKEIQSCSKASNTNKPLLSDEEIRPFGCSSANLNMLFHDMLASGTNNKPILPEAKNKHLFDETYTNYRNRNQENKNLDEEELQMKAKFEAKGKFTQSCIEAVLGKERKYDLQNLEESIKDKIKRNTKTAKKLLYTIGTNGTIAFKVLLEKTKESEEERESFIRKVLNESVLVANGFVCKEFIKNEATGRKQNYYSLTYNGIILFDALFGNKSQLKYNAEEAKKEENSTEPDQIVLDFDYPKHKKLIEKTCEFLEKKGFSCKKETQFKLGPRGSTITCDILATRNDKDYWIECETEENNEKYQKENLIKIFCTGKTRKIFFIASTDEVKEDINKTVQQAEFLNDTFTTATFKELRDEETFDLIFWPQNVRIKKEQGFIYHKNITDFAQEMLKRLGCVYEEEAKFELRDGSYAICDLFVKEEKLKKNFWIKCVTMPEEKEKDFSKEIRKAKEVAEGANVIFLIQDTDKNMALLKKCLANAKEGTYKILTTQTLGDKNLARMALGLLPLETEEYKQWKTTTSARAKKTGNGTGTKTKQDIGQRKTGTKANGQKKNVGATTAKGKAGGKLQSQRKTEWKFKSHGQEAWREKNKDKTKAEAEARARQEKARTAKPKVEAEERAKAEN